MDVDIADSAAEQTVTADEVQDLGIGGDPGLRKIRQGIQDNDALTEITEGEFAQDKGMCQHASCIEEVNKRLVPGTEMV
jgi:hypothetical protein